MEPVNKVNLDLMAARGCQHPGCTDTSHDVVLSGHCHPGRGTYSSYRQGTGIVVVKCLQCHREVLQIKVAE